MKDFQYIIIGAGCAGMQMANSLLELPKETVSSILIIESEKNHNEKSWCFWYNKNHKYRNLVKKEWGNIVFRSNNFYTSQPLEKDSYQYINSTDFYNHHLELFRNDSRVTLCYDKVLEIKETDLGCTVLCKNQEFRSKVLFNSIPNLVKETNKKPKIWQHFLGLEVKLKTKKFDTNTVTLMDFDVDNSADGRFIYILPFSDNTALIECTLFSDKILKDEVYENVIDKYLKLHFNDDYSVLSKEKGQIPMQLVHLKKDFQKIIPIGTAAGCIKASTGYSFVRNMLNTSHIIANLAPSSPKIKGSPKRFLFYDRLLLFIIERYPSKIKFIFSSLFKNNTVSRIFLFLDEKTNIWQDLKIFSGLPVFLFLKALLQLKSEKIYPQISTLFKSFFQKKSGIKINKRMGFPYQYHEQAN
jgi:lycopene beta-cyclase